MPARVERYRHFDSRIDGLRSCKFRVQPLRLASSEVGSCPRCNLQRLSHSASSGTLEVAARAGGADADVVITLVAGRANRKVLLKKGFALGMEQEEEKEEGR